MLDVAALLMLAPMLIAEGRPQLVVIVRQDLERPLSPATVAGIAREVRDLWRPHVDVALASPDQAAGLPVDDTLDLLLTDRERPRAGDGLGWIEFVNGEPSRRISVSVTMAKTLADGGSWLGRPIAAWPAAVRETFMIRALGRGIAHEVGHYLLRSKTHTPRGLMREIFSVAEIMAPASGGSLFAADDVSRLQRRAASYLLARIKVDAEPG
jgi:hypothetical protein